MTDEITTLAGISRHWARQAPERTAITAGERTWTFAELDAEACRVAQGLQTLGIGAGSRVAYLDKNTPEYFTHLFGGAKLNAVSVAVNWRLAPPEMQFIIDDADATVLFIGDEFLGHLEQMALPKVQQVIVVGDAGESGHVAYADWIQPFDPIDPNAPIAGSDTCYQLYTSGTTGLPKGVELTNDNLLATMGIGRDAWRFHGDDLVNLVAMPLFHIAGSGWALAGMVNGAHTILAREVNPFEILELIPKHHITHALLVPAVLQFVLSVPGASDVDLSSMRSLVYGASPITEAVLAGSLALFECDFMQAYGLTETTGGVVQLDPEDHDPGGDRAHLLRAAGKPWGDVELRVVDPDSLDDMPDGDVGEVWVRSKQVMKGYWKNADATEQAITDGWFRTGDAGYLIDGYLFIHDRVKDMVVSGGENIYPAEIENALMKHDGIADVAVIGVPHDKWGETVKAVVVRADPDLDEAAVIAFAKQHLASYKCPTSVDWVDALPRNPSGKPTFVEVTAVAGLLREERGLGALLTDVDRDGDLDLYIANDGHRNRLYENQPTDNGLGFQFVDLSDMVDVGDSGSGMGVAGGDYDGNGYVDLFVTNWDTELNALYRNRTDEQGAINFVYSTYRIGFQGLGRNMTGWGTHWADFDQDGDEDLLFVNGRVPVTNLETDPELVRFFGNQLVEGRPGEFREWTEVVRLEAVGTLLARGSAAADFDNDGDLDVAINTIAGQPALLRNDFPAGNWLMVELEGFWPGALVTVVLPDGRLLIREWHVGSSYLASEDTRLHFGLGEAEQVTVLVQWPDGRQTELSDIAANQQLLVSPSE